MAPSIRPIHDDELAAWIGSLHVAFNKHGDPVAEADFRRPFTDLSRCLGAFEGERIVGTFRSLGLTLSVPGGGLVDLVATVKAADRPLDVVAALAARRYAVEGRVVLEVHDPDGYAAGPSS